MTKPNDPFLHVGPSDLVAWTRSQDPLKFEDTTQKKPKRKNVMLEDNICINDIVPTLKFMQNYNQFKHPVQWTKIANEAYDKSIIVGAKQKRMGKKAGTADYFLGWRYGWGWIEVKAPGKKQQPTQVAFEKETLDAGGKYVVVHNGDELRAALKKWGVLK